MYNFDPYNVFLAISTNISCAAYDCFCGPGSQLSFMLDFVLSSSVLVFLLLSPHFLKCSATISYFHLTVSKCSFIFQRHPISAPYHLQMSLSQPPHFFYPPPSPNSSAFVSHITKYKQRNIHPLNTTQTLKQCKTSAQESAVLSVPFLTLVGYSSNPPNQCRLD